MAAAGATDVTTPLENTRFAVRFLRQVAQTNDPQMVPQFDANAQARANAVMSIAMGQDADAWSRSYAALLQNGSDCNRYVSQLIGRRDAGTLRVQ